MCIRLSCAVVMGSYAHRRNKPSICGSFSLCSASLACPYNTSPNHFHFKVPCLSLPHFVAVLFNIDLLTYENKSRHVSILRSWESFAGVCWWKQGGVAWKRCLPHPEAGGILKNPTTHHPSSNINLHLFHSGWSCKRIPSCGPRREGLVCVHGHTALAAQSRAGPNSLRYLGQGSKKAEF